MSFPLLSWRAAKIAAREKLTPVQRRLEDHKDLSFWTNFGLGLAVALGLVVIVAHRGVLTAGMAAFGAALGVGGVLGFLFGIPSMTKPQVNVGKVETLAVAGDGAKAVSGNVQLPASSASASPPGQNAPLTPAAGSSPPVPGASGAAPKASTGRGPSPDTSSTPYVSGQSNLEQVADWITKLLLGGGLTQMSKIPPKIWSWAYLVALGILGPNTNPAHPFDAQTILAAQSFAAGLLVYGFILGFFSGYLITKLQLGKAISD